MWGVTAAAANAGVFGFNFGSGPGVRGHSVVATPQGPAPSGNGTGVEGRSGGGTGVHGAVTVASGIGVRAENAAGGLGLGVCGRVAFSTCGTDSIAAGQASKSVADPDVTAHSHIMVTLTGDPGPQAAALWVQRQPGTGFVVHLQGGAINPTPFTYLIVEPFGP